MGVHHKWGGGDVNAHAPVLSAKFFPKLTLLFAVLIATTLHLKMSCRTGMNLFLPLVIFFVNILAAQMNSTFFWVEEKSR